MFAMYVQIARKVPAKPGLGIAHATYYFDTQRCHNHGRGSQDAWHLHLFGLGDPPNDLPLLEAVDQAVVVPGALGPHPVFQEAIASGRFQLAPAPHGEGWARAVSAWLANESR